MVLYVLLIILFLLVFGWLAWRIVLKQVASAQQPKATYVCPVCNEENCSCYKKADDG